MNATVMDLVSTYFFICVHYVKLMRMKEMVLMDVLYAPTINCEENYKSPLEWNQIRVKNSGKRRF